MTFLKNAGYCITSKTAKRFAWTLFNSLTAIGLALIIYLIYPEIFATIIVVPLATAISQMITKMLNTPKPTL